MGGPFGPYCHDDDALWPSKRCARSLATLGPRGPIGRSRITDRFIADSEQCATLGDLGDLLKQTTRTLGFRHVALVAHGRFGHAHDGSICVHNYPDGWSDELGLLLGGVPDPIQAASERTNCGFRWSDVQRLVRLDCRQRAVLDQATRIGLGGGFTVPANIPGEGGASCSFAVARADELPLNRLLCAETIGAHAFQAACRLDDLRLRSRRVRLSPRERQCVGLIARGKTDWEIAHILGIGLETVRTYVKHARNLYGVVSRTQLAIHGLRDAHIGFGDAIPRTGE